MKTYENFISSDIIIKEVKWDNIKNFLKKYKIANKLQHNLNNVVEFDIYKNYKILIAINNNIIVGYFYKYLGGNENLYDDGYVESDMKGVGSKLLNEMKKLGHYTTFCRIGNIPSLKMHFKANPSKIICISDGSPEKKNYGSSKYNKISKKYKDILESGKLYYSNGKEKYPLIKDNKINKDIINFILNNKNINVLFDNEILNKDNYIMNLKYYLLY